MDFVALDFETANEKRSSACALGVAIVERGRVVESFSRLIKPREGGFNPWNVRIHGITAEQVQDAPAFDRVWTEVHRTIGERIIVAHNAAFDVSVLRHSLFATGTAFPEIKYLCSLKVASRQWPMLPSHSLGFLARLRGIPLDHHDPESDAKAAALLLLEAASDLGVTSLTDVAAQLGVSIGRCCRDGGWVPSSAPSVRANADVFVVDFPSSYDVSRHPLYRKQVVFTGTLEFCTRGIAFSIVEQCGGVAKDNVSRKTDVLVTGHQDIRMLADGACESSKLRKARDLRSQGHSLQIVSETDFQRMVCEFDESDDNLPQQRN
ncbi:MAG: exonuclease domain-containing protein [Pirellulales bacterium]